MKKRTAVLMTAVAIALVAGSVTAQQMKRGDDGEYHRLGEAQARRSSFRLVAATNRSLEILKHDFLARFTHRITLPGLSERRDDVPLMLADILRRTARQNPGIAAMTRVISARRVPLYPRRRRTHVMTTQRTVADISRDPRALEILKEAGINHCCGAHLTLTEGAAAAGVALAPLLARLEALLPAEVLDVRGLEPPEPMQRTLEILETLPVGGTLMQINSRVPQFLLPLLEERGFEYTKMSEAGGVVTGLIRRNQEK